MLAERERGKVGGGKETVHNMLGRKGESRGAAKRQAASRDVVGEGCSDGADLRPTSSFPCPDAWQGRCCSNVRSSL